jgi:3D (Asp-Asp-Asp) domain-containing protein
MDRPPIGNGDLTVLGPNANQNQNEFRKFLGLLLGPPTPEQIKKWKPYHVRFTEYSDKDPDWRSQSSASGNWKGKRNNRGDPINLPGSSIAVDFKKIPRGSLVYIPKFDMYAEANDTGATGHWKDADTGKSDYGPDGGGRIDLFHLSGKRNSEEVEDQFNRWIGNDEYGDIFVVYKGSDWKLHIL